MAVNQVESDLESGAYACCAWAQAATVAQQILYFGEFNKPSLTVSTDHQRLINKPEIGFENQRKNLQHWTASKRHPKMLQRKYSFRFRNQ